jgi:hypothetical protein
MSFEEKLAEKARQVKQYIPATELPLELEAIVVAEPVFKTDKRGNEGCFITLKTRDGKFVAQKYTPTQYAALEAAVKACGGIKALMSDYFVWRKQRVGRAMNERLFPVPKAPAAAAAAEVSAEVELEERARKRPKKVEPK